MAANIVVIRDQEKWDSILEVLDGLGEGGIIITPEVAKSLDKGFFDWEDKLQHLVEYDFAGDPEIFIDVAVEGSYAESFLVRCLAAPRGSME